MFQIGPHRVVHAGVVVGAADVTGVDVVLDALGLRELVEGRVDAGGRSDDVDEADGDEGLRMGAR